MHKTVLSRLTLSSVRLLMAARLLLAVLFLLGGVRVAKAAPETRTPFPHSLKLSAKAQKSVSLTGAPVEPSKAVEFQITLRMRDFAKLQDRLSRGERVSEAELRERYFPKQEDYQAVVSWAKAQGLAVLNENDLTRLSVRLRGPVGTVERVLATKYAQVTVDGASYLAAQNMPSLPARVAASVLGITGLQPYLRMLQPDSITIAGAAPYIPSDVLQAYQATGLKSALSNPINGAGQTIAIIADRAPNEIDVTTFWKRAKVADHIGQAYSAFVTNVNLTGEEMLEPPDNADSTLAVSWATGIATGAQVRLYVAGSTDVTAVDKALQQIVTDTQPGNGNPVRITQLSLGFSFDAPESGADDQIATQSQYFATLAARGVSTFVASGDTGDVYYPASDPSVTAVGGTTMRINLNTQTIASEIAWNNEAGMSGGGTSSIFPPPAYQTGNGIGVDEEGQVVSAGRQVPDVSSVADPNIGAFLVFGKVDPDPDDKVGNITAGRTSWSTPTWAAFGALINQAREDANLPDAGLLNPGLYSLYLTDNFRDITAGAPAAPGYDTVTGLGTPVLSKIIASLTNGGDLTIASFTPDSGTPGTQVTINGTQLDQVISVRFNGTSATEFGAVSGTQLVATVPAGATTGPITVTGRDGTTATSPTSFTVLPVGSAQNDNFADAQPIGPAQSRLVGSNVGASKEDGEPDHAGNPGGASIWYRWTPPVDGTYTFNTFGSSFDTLLAVYTGNSVDTLTEVVSNDDLSTGVTSSVVFQAAYGTTYYIAVDGAQQAGGGDAAQGTVVLNLSSANDAPVINDFDPPRGTVGQTIRIFGANFLSVVRVQFNGTSATFRIDSASQISAIVPPGASNGPISVTDNAGRDSTSARRFTVLTTPDNDQFANSRTITGTQSTQTGSNIGASKQAGEPNHGDNTGGASVWFVWTAPNTGVYTFNTFGSNFDTLLAVYTGDTVSSLVTVAQNDDAGALGTSSVTFNAQGGTVYHIAVDGFNGAQGDYRLNLSVNSGRPVINSFTPTSGGAGTNVVLTGTGFQTVTSVKFNGTEAPGFAINSDTQITVQVPTGATTGPISATGLNGTAVTSTNFTVLPLPPNDLFRNSQLLTGGAPIVVTGSNAGATKEPGEPAIIEGDNGGRSIWYTWTPPVSGDYTITTRGSDFDTLLGIYTGATVSTLTPIAANDDDPEGGVTSAVTLTAIRGTTYRIVVDGSEGEAGNVSLSILGTTAIQSIYTTNFEPSEGFDSKKPLVGQSGWISVNDNTGGNAIAVNQIPNLGQQGLVGQTPLNNGATSIKVYHPLNYVFSRDFPIVNFSTVVKLVGSTNGQNDRFGFTFSGAQDNSSGGDELGQYFSIIFDNANLQVYYQLPGDVPMPTGVSFTHDAVYSLQATLDFQSGTWSATLNGTVLATDQTLASQGVLTRVSADWMPVVPAAPGNNYMVFDQYSVIAPAMAVPVITLQPATQTILDGQSVTFVVAATGTLPLFYQWYYEGVAITDATSATYTIPVVTQANAGRYSVVVKNEFGSARSLDAFLIVSAPPAANGAVISARPGAAVVDESSIGSAATVVLTRKGDLSGSLVVAYTVHGTAKPGIDYQPLSRTVTFKAGQAKRRIRVVPIDRGIRDGSQVKVVVKLLEGNGYTVERGTAKVKLFIQR